MPSRLSLECRLSCEDRRVNLTIEPRGHRPRNPRPAVQKSRGRRRHPDFLDSAALPRFRTKLMAAVASERGDRRHRDLGETVDALCRAAEQLGLFELARAYKPYIEPRSLL